MKQLVVLSGKGGTGKTSVAAALAQIASAEMSLVLADADVDAANLELVLDPREQERHKFWSGQVAVIDPGECAGCGICEQVCRFEAVLESQDPGSPFIVDPLACEGCAACFYQCPEEAIRMEDQLAGQWFRSETPYGPLFHAQLFAGQENSGKLVTLLKQQARLLALDQGADLLLVDGPPGIGCPVISASAGADLALHVVEPTVSGVHDLERILATTDHFGVPSLALINKADINPSRAEEIADYCMQREVPLVGRVPYDERVLKMMVQGKPVTADGRGPAAMALHAAWPQIRGALFAGGGKYG